MRKIHRLLCGIALLAAGAVMAAELVDINTATAEQLAEAMKDVGKAKAEAIVKYREANGPFKSVDDLARVKGIKAATINKNRDRVVVGGNPPSPPPVAPATGAGTGAAPAGATGVGAPPKAAPPPKPGR